MDAATLKGWRYSLAVLLSIEAAILASISWSLQRFKPVDGNWFLVALAGSPLALGLVYALTVTGLVFFLGRRSRLLWGFVALGGMKLLYEVFGTIFSAHHETFLQAGTILLGFVLGETYARVLGVRGSDGPEQWLAARRLGATGALALFAATYISAGLSKVLHGGLNWLDSEAIRLMVLAHTEVGTTAWKDAIGHWVGASPRFCAALQVGTIIVQLGAFLLLAGARLRTLWAALIVAFHLGIYLTSNILFIQALIFAAIIAFPWRWVADRWRGAPAESASDPATKWLPSGEQLAARQGAWLRIAAGLVAILWLTSPGLVYAAHWGQLVEMLRRVVEGLVQ